MGGEGISKIEAVGLPASMAQRTPLEAGRTGGEEQRAGNSHLATAMFGVREAHEPAPGGPEVRGESARRELLTADDTYVKIRYDKSAHTYVIQVRSTSNDEVISEIPPDAWDGFSGNPPLPKGTIVEKAQ